MATLAPSLGPSICADKQRLGDAFMEAVREVMALQDQELAAMARGGDGFERIDLALEQARNKRDSAKKRYIVHIRAHGCY